VFQGPRRYFLKARSGKQDIWSYGLSLGILVGNEFEPLYFPVSKRLKALPIFGSVSLMDIFSLLRWLS
jgi:hypothetical protein